MDDTRGAIVAEELRSALMEARRPTPDLGRIAALLNDAQCGVVELVSNGIGDGMKRRDLNSLDAANLYLRQACDIAEKRREWLVSSVEQLAKAAREQVLLVLSDNVVPLRRRNTTGGGAA